MFSLMEIPLTKKRVQDSLIFSTTSRVIFAPIIQVKMFKYVPLPNTRLTKILERMNDICQPILEFALNRY